MLSLILAAGLAVAGDYLVGVGDTVQVEVLGEEDLAVAMRIPASCELHLHLLGAVPVCDRTTAQITADIRGRLAADYLVDPRVLVQLESYGSQSIEVKGEVAKPGIVVLEGPTTLSQAITRAGGPSRANVFEANLVRGPEIRRIYLPDQDRVPVWVRPGDVVVLQPPAEVYVHGEVKEEGPVAYRQGLTVTEALAMAGGVTLYAGLSRTLVVKPDGEKVRVNVRRIQRGLDADLQLRPDDKLVVRRSYL